MTIKGHFITVEGIDGVGKSSAMSTILSQLERAGFETQATREPGGTMVGERIRELIMGAAATAMCLDAELLLFFAARAQHLHEVIHPNLNAGRWVIADRFTDASYAYQSGGKGIPESKMAQLEHWVQLDFGPELTLLLDAPVAVCRQRAAQRGGAVDHFEAEQDAFFERVRATYLTRAAAAPERFVIIDAAESMASVQRQITEALNAFIKAHV